MNGFQQENVIMEMDSVNVKITMRAKNAINAVLVFMIFLIANVSCSIDNNLHLKTDLCKALFISTVTNSQSSRKS